jgi:hypothetical protein
MPPIRPIWPDQETKTGSGFTTPRLLVVEFSVSGRRFNGPIVSGCDQRQGSFCHLGTRHAVFDVQLFCQVSALAKLAMDA